jgi:hypothetical protein
MKILKTNLEVKAEAGKDTKPRVGVVPLSKEQIEEIRLLQTQANHKELPHLNTKEEGLLEQSQKLYQEWEKKQKKHNDLKAK